MPLASLCTRSGWSADWTDGDPFDMGSSCLITEAWEAIRQRWAISGGDVDELERSPTCGPAGSWIWDSGKITSITDNGDGTITIRDNREHPPGTPVHNWTDGSAIDRWHDFGGTFNGVNIGDAPFCAPASYKIVIFPLDSGTPPATVLADPARGVVLGPILDNDDDSVKVRNDGRMLLNGEALSDYVGCGFHIIRAGDGPGFKEGWGWIDRYPPHNNHPEIDYGEVIASTTSSLTDSRDASTHGYKCPKQFAASLVGKDVVFQTVATGNPWVRVSITGVVPSVGGAGNVDTLQFDELAFRPAEGTKYYVVEPGKWFRPERALNMRKRRGRKGDFWDDEGSGRWRAWCIWYGGNYTLAPRVTHDPALDVLVGAGTQQTTVNISDGTLDGADFTVFDNDAKSDATVAPEQNCNVSDLLFSPRLFWSLRGLQLWIEALFSAIPWVAPIDYTGAASIPRWVQATWRKYWQVGATRTATITATSDPSGGTATIAITMPTKTPQFGAWPSLACYFALLDTDGTVKYEGTGTATAATLTDAGMRGFIDDGDTDVGLTVVISFGWQRRYYRRINHLYERTVASPDSNLGAPVWPPDPDIGGDAFVGEYATTPAATKYCEFDELGEAREDGDDFVDGEAALYAPDDFDYPSLPDFADPDDPLAPFADLAFMGLPDLVSNGSAFPRFEASQRKGVIDSVDSGQFGDSSKLWWVSSSTSYEHGEAAADAASDASHLKWPAAATDAAVMPFWDTGRPQRFVAGGGMVIEVELNPGGAPGVYSRRPISTQSSSGTPTLGWALPFPSSIAGKRWRIREPGYIVGKGAILNTWRGRKVRITKADNSASQVIIVGQSDDTHCYFTPPDSFTIEIGDSYELLEFKPGVVVQRKSGHADSADEAAGWVLTSSALATADTRGRPWITQDKAGVDAAFCNAPTFVHAYGRFRRGDDPSGAGEFWTEIHDAIDCLRAIRTEIEWVDGQAFVVDDAGADFYSGIAHDATYHADLTTGYSSVIAAYGSGSIVDIGDGVIPHGDTRVEVTRNDGPGGTGGMDVEIVGGLAAASKGKTLSPTPLLKSSTEFYARAGGSNFGVSTPFQTTNSPGTPICNTGGGFRAWVFDAFGTGLLYNQFFKWLTDGPTDVIERRSSVRVGDAANSATPHWPTDPTNPHTIDPCSLGDGEPFTAGIINGFQVYDQCAVLRFDVAGGLTYYEP